MKIEKKTNMIIITADAGYVLTNWDEENLLDFSYCRMVYAPVNSKVDDYREITGEEAEEIIEKQRIEFEKMEKMDNKN